MATAWSQEWPSRPVRFISVANAGSSTDLVVRVLATKLNERLGWTTVVENRPGGDFIVPTMVVVQAPPDGYTVLQAVSALPILPLTNKEIPYDLLRDLAPVTRIATIDSLMVLTPSIPVKNFQELVEYSKANPGKITYAAAGASNNLRFVVEHLKLLSGLNATFVNYKSALAFIPDLLEGRIAIGMTSVGNVAEHIRNGKLRAIIATQPHRNDRLPEVPSTTDIGYSQVDSGAWFGLMVPGKTPRPIIDRLHKETVAILQLQEVKDAYAKTGSVVTWEKSPEDFRKRLEYELANWAKIARDAKMTFN